MPQRGWIPEIDIGNSNFLYLALGNYGLESLAQRSFMYRKHHEIKALVESMNLFGEVKRASAGRLKKCR
jgi:hypothetical protein